LGKSTDAAPKIKMKKLTGTSAATENAEVSIAHGLTLAKILSVDILMHLPSFVVDIPPCYKVSSGYEYQYQITASNIVVFNIATNSSQILSKGFTILITYEE